MDAQNLVTLKRRWRLVTAVYALTFLSMYAGLRAAWPCCAGRWLGLTAVTAVLCLGGVWRHLPDNHRPGETAVLPRFGWGNRLTLLRGLLISMVAGFLFSPWAGGWVGWLPAIFYTLADIADYLDGYAARITHHATRLGQQLDMTFDGLGMLVVTLLAVWTGQLPRWYLLIGLGRYFFLLGLWLRQRFGWSLYPMPFSWHRRIFAGFQMGFMSVVLWPIVPAAGATIAGTMFALATGTSFLRDWLVVIGWLRPGTAVYRQWQRRLYRAMAVILPPLLRLWLLCCLVVLAADIRLPAWAALFTTWGLPGPAAIAAFWAVAGLLAAIMVVLGAAGRLMALLLMFPLGFELLTAGLTFWNGTAVAVAVFIMLLGSGAFSLWQPEEKFMVWHAGT